MPLREKNAGLVRTSILLQAVALELRTSDALENTAPFTPVAVHPTTYLENPNAFATVSPEV